MNQLDWEKMKEDIKITDVTRVSPWFVTQSEYKINVGRRISGTYTDTQVVDSSYETFTEATSGTPSCYPSEYILGESTSRVSGDVSDLTSDDGVYMTFRSYSSGTDTSDFVDNNTSDVDSSADKGTHSNFSAQQAGPDSIYDTLTEENTVPSWKVQSGTGSIGLGNTYTIVNIDPVTLSKSFLLVKFGGGIAGTQPEQDVIVSGKFNSASQLRFDRVGTTNPANFGWYVIEALSTQISVQSGTTQFASTETQKDVTITDVTDTSKCVVFLSRRSTGTDRTQYNKCFVTGELTSATNLRLKREGTGTIVTVEWFVVKFNDGTTIQTGETAVSTSNPTTQSITSVDLSRTWLYFTWRATANGLAQVSPRGWLESSTEIRWFRQTTTGICYVRWFVIQMPSGTSVQRGNHDSTVNTEYTKDITITPVALNRAFSFTTCDSTGTGDYFPRPFWIERITNTTNLHLERWYAGQTSDHSWQIIELPTGIANYELVLEVQWTNATYDLPNEELCIFGGTMGSEDIRVDVWDGTAWQNLFPDLTSGWNNASVSSYLASSTFTIRFKGGTETGDTAQDNWNIDVTLLHVWFDEYTMEVEFAGSSNTENWIQLTWIIDSAWTSGSVSVTLQLYNYTLGDYPTSGNGYISYFSSATPNTDETESQTITENPTHFRDATGYWKMKVKGVKATNTSFDFKADWVELSPTIEYTGYRLDSNGTFTIDLSTYPLAYIETVEIQLRYMANDTVENWYLKAYNWTDTTYSDSGFNFTAGHMPTTGWDYYAVSLTDQWRSYVKDDGTMYIKFHDEETDNNQTTIDIDFLGARALFDGILFVFKNEGAMTTHLVSLWVINSTSHERYDINLFINPGETLSYLSTDILLPDGQYTVKVVTERGNVAVYSGG